jgi:hypothetical protein
VYIPVLYNAGVGFTVVPTPYLIMGLHSAMDTTNLMDGMILCSSFFITFDYHFLWWAFCKVS